MITTANERQGAEKGRLAMASSTRSGLAPASLTLARCDPPAMPKTASGFSTARRTARFVFVVSSPRAQRHAICSVFCHGCCSLSISLSISSISYRGASYLTSTGKVNHFSPPVR